MIRNPNNELWDYFEQLQTQHDSPADDSSLENSLAEFDAALRSDKKYTTILKINGEDRQIYGTPLPCSEWYLVGVMPYGILNQTINSLSAQRMYITLLACASVLILLTLIFSSVFFHDPSAASGTGKDP